MTKNFTDKELKRNLKNINYLENIDRLGLKPEEMIIGASAACILYGMPIKNKDIDIIVTKKAINRIKHLLNPGEQDGVHNKMYQDTEGVLDIGIEPGNNWFKWDKYEKLTLVVGAYRFLSIEGLYKFYQELYNFSGKEKHLNRLQWVKNNLIISSGNEAFNPNKRKQIQDKILKTMKLIEPGMSNHNRYQEMFNNMNDKQFDTFMKDLKEGKIKLTLFAPNMKVFIQQEDLLKAADDLGLELFERLRFKDKATGKYFLTPNKYLIAKLPVRRTRQFLMHKLSVAENDKKLDALTGQVTANDKASSLSYPEAQLMYARGLDKSIIEFMKVRGGDIHAFATFKQQLEESGEATLGSLDPNTLPRSAVVMSSILKSMYFDNNLV